ncbi:MAG: GatB/YqeY domain-containing protein [Candidatus Omnitrophica bacterium]|nr:GatB/YqeY domain-containing protein [Candidatus Omnitrophota bacterium]
MLFDQISSDYISAMKAKDSTRSATLNFLRAQLKNVIIEKRADKLDDPDVISVIKKQVKQRQDSIEQYKAGGREDLVQKEQAELEILQSYLPEEMSDENLEEIVASAITETQAGSMKDMGKVIKLVMEKTSGQADNKRISESVKFKLSQL